MSEKKDVPDMEDSIRMAPPVPELPKVDEEDLEEEKRRKRKMKKRATRAKMMKFSESRKNQLLTKYFDIVEKKTKPLFVRSRESGELKQKVKEAYEVMTKCELCEHKCGVNRMEGELGYCKGGNKPEVFVSFPHYGDEEFLVPSFTVFFCGCNMKCQFCQNWQISQRIEGEKCQYCGKGKEHKKTCGLCKKRENMKVKDIEEMVDNNSKECTTVQWIGGEPTPSVAFILDSLQTIKTPIPTIFKSNFYFSTRTFELLNGVVDVWLSDWKFGNDACAERLAKVKNYWDVVRRNHDLVLKKGAPGAVLVLRHLVMPNHVECCSIPILEYISKNYGKNVIVNLMDQYQPCWKAKDFEDIRGIPSRRELKQIYKYADRLNLVWISH